MLNRIFQKAFQAAKHVRTHTAIGEGQISVASVAVDLALKIFGDLQRCHVLVLGAGDIGEKTARAFKSRGAGMDDRGQPPASACRGTGPSFAAAAIPLAEATACPSSTLRSAPPRRPSRWSRRPRGRGHAARAARPLFFIDLAMPRNIAPDVAALANVFLYNLDDLAKIAEENIALRQAELVGRGRCSRKRPGPSGSRWSRG